MGSYGIDWNNVDLNSPCESYQNLIENLTFNSLLLEINSNLSVIDEKTVAAQFEDDLQGRVRESRDIFRANLANIIAHAKKEREDV